MLRPWRSVRLRPLIASSPPDAISTNPNPRDCPVSRSVTTWALVTVPNRPNSCSRSADVVVNARFPTYRFLLMRDSGPGQPADRFGPAWWPDDGTECGPRELRPAGWHRLSGGPDGHGTKRDGRSDRFGVRAGRRPLPL